MDTRTSAALRKHIGGPPSAEQFYRPPGRLRFLTRPHKHTSPQPPPRTFEVLFRARACIAGRPSNCEALARTRRIARSRPYIKNGAILAGKLSCSTSRTFPEPGSSTCAQRATSLMVWAGCISLAGHARLRTAHPHPSRARWQPPAAHRAALRLPCRLHTPTLSVLKKPCRRPTCATTLVSNTPSAATSFWKLWLPPPHPK
jgi:hypothetical protein